MQIDFISHGIAIDVRDKESFLLAFAIPTYAQCPDSGTRYSALPQWDWSHISDAILHYIRHAQPHSLKSKLVRKNMQRSEMLVIRRRIARHFL